MTERRLSHGDIGRGTYARKTRTRCRSRAGRWALREGRTADGERGPAGPRIRQLRDQRARGGRGRHPAQHGAVLGRNWWPAGTSSGAAAAGQAAVTAGRGAAGRGTGPRMGDGRRGRARGETAVRQPGPERIPVPAGGRRAPER